MRGLYPLIQPNQTYELSVDSIHTLYIEESGNPDGIPLLFLHGGPGGGSNAGHRCFYDPERYRMILFDQRGAGRSTPHASLEENTTWTLVKDIEKVRQYLGVEQWVVAGGSWGTTLALCYAISHPGKVLGLILRGIFLGRKEDIRWLYYPDGGAAQIFPEYYQDFIKKLQPTDDIIESYYDTLTNADEVKRLSAAKRWAIWEGRISTLHLKPNVEEYFGDPHLALSLSRIECHYFKHQCFLEENYILDHINAIQQIPGFIIHGRYDVVCKLENAYQLSNAWDNGKLQIVPAAGHASIEPAIADALCRASDLMADFLKEDKL
ncbi:prolyl aminopeptidase [Algicola sagamiensis]|uniref:prolyl aminopeptidase n=1 Tax=Algicola sagamiensis TaxID=163869 RepID=UPI00036C23A7|nr:prolyl aminopeptidase [Algicola sagamiensis]